MSYPPPTVYGTSSSSSNYLSLFQTAPSVLRDGAGAAAPSTSLRPPLPTTGSSSSEGSSFDAGNRNIDTSSASKQQQRPAVGSRGQPLTAPVKRGSACLRCRKHKLKCDAIKPHCSACIKHHGLQLSVEPNGPAALAGPDCSWDPEKAPKRAKRQRVGDGEGGDNGASGPSSSARTTVAPKTKRRAVAAASEDPSGGESSDSVDGRREQVEPSTTTAAGSTMDADHVRALEKKVRHMEALLGSLGVRPLADLASSVAELPRPSSVPGASLFVPGPASQAYPQSLSERGPVPSNTKVNKVAAAAGTGGPYDQAGPPAFTPSSFFDPPTPFGQTTGLDDSWPGVEIDSQSAPPSEADYSGRSTDLLPSSYPPRLPPPRLLLSLVTTFWDRVPLGISGLLHRPSFMRDLQRGPDDRLFPHVAILHAMCALTARYSGLTSPHEPPASASFAPPPLSTSAPDSARANRLGLADPLDKESFGARHAIWAAEEIEIGIACAERLFEVTIAHVILSNFDFLHARWIQIWQSSAGALRKCIPLGINEATDSVVIAGCKPGLLLPAEDAIERESRRRVFWSAFICDRLASISSGWPHSLEEADVTVELPTSLAEFARGTLMKENTQTLRSPNLFSSHYPATTDGYVLSLKAVILLARVKHFNRRTLKESGLATVGQDDAGHERLKATGAWRMVQSQVELFRTTLPKVTQEGTGIDPNLIFAHALVYTAAITLHEHHVNLMAFGDPSSAYILAAARAQLSLLFTIFSTNFDVMRLPPFLVFTWYVAGRTLVRFLQAASFVKDEFAVKTLNSELAMFRMALYNLAEKIPVAQRQAALLDQAIQDALSAEPMRAPYLCPIAVPSNASETKKVPTQLSTAHLSAVSASDGASPAATSSPHSYSPSAWAANGTGFVAEISSGSSSGGRVTSTAPTVSPSSMPGSAFSPVSSPEDYLSRPPHDPPPLKTRDELRTPNYASLPGLEGVDEGLIHSLFGPGAFGSFDGVGPGGVTSGVTGESPFSIGIDVASDGSNLSAYPSLW